MKLYEHPYIVRVALRATMETMQFRKAQMCLFFKNIVFSFIGPKKQFGTNEKLSGGARLVKLDYVV